MALNTSQLLLVKAEILADPVLNAEPDTADGAFAIAQKLNLLAVPAFIVWRTNVPRADCKKAMVWTEFIARLPGERESWQFMLADGSINAAEVNIRQGINDIFSGPGGAGSRANLLAIAKRSARRIEKILATGPGTDPAPATMEFEGTISFGEVQTARAM